MKMKTKATAIREMSPAEFNRRFHATASQLHAPAVEIPPPTVRLRRKPRDKRRDKRVWLRVSFDDLKLWKAAATLDGRSLSDWVTRTCNVVVLDELEKGGRHGKR